MVNMVEQTWKTAALPEFFSGYDIYLICLQNQKFYVYIYSNKV